MYLVKSCVLKFLLNVSCRLGHSIAWDDRLYAGIAAVVSFGPSVLENHRYLVSVAQHSALAKCSMSDSPFSAFAL